MRKVNVTEYVSLDGVMESPHEWSGPYFSDQVGRFKNAELFVSDALLLGRVTYEGFAAAWPSRTDEQGFADRINSLPKYVATKTLTNLEWNNSKPITNVADEVRKLKEEPGQDILVYGSKTLVNSLIPLDLIDEYQIMVFPLFLGSGKRMFDEGIEKTGLKHLRTTTFDSGVVVLTYEPERDE